MKRTASIAIVLLFIFSGFINVGHAQRPAASSADPRLERTRQQVKMLDDLYKTTVVLVTEHYVITAKTLSAATAAKALFGEMDKKGWHQVRLVGLTDKLYNKQNAPADAFESAAAKRLLAGEASHEAVVTENGKQYLRYATPIPVVMEKCVMCHPQWKGEKGNVGSLMYKVPMID
jgi:Protein of unknown function (DUF3365)